MSGRLDKVRKITSRIEVLVHPFFGSGIPKIAYLAARSETFRLPFEEKNKLVNKIWKKAIAEVQKDNSRIMILIPHSFSSNAAKKVFLEKARSGSFDKFEAGIVLHAMKKLEDRAILHYDLEDWAPVFKELKKRNIRLAPELEVVTYGAYVDACVKRALDNLVKHLETNGFKIKRKHAGLYKSVA
jgi:hypothetical protein